jgi:hypothetical protein
MSLPDVHLALAERVYAQGTDEKQVGAVRSSHFPAVENPTILCGGVLKLSTLRDIAQSTVH